MADLDALSREVAVAGDGSVRLALAALKANPPPFALPLIELGRAYLADANEVFVTACDGMDVQRHIAAVVNAAPVLAAEVEAIYAKIPATYNGNLDAIFAHARGYQDLGITMAYAQHAEDSDDLSYEEQLALLIKQRDGAVAEVERLTAQLEAARWKVEQLPRYEEHMCTIEVLGATDLDLANEALDRARRAVGLEG